MSHLKRILDLSALLWAPPLLPVEKQMLVAIALFALLVPFGVSEFDAVRVAPLRLFGAFAYGMFLGVMTGVVIVVSRRWRR
jgi:hypothetical protein